MSVSGEEAARKANGAAPDVQVIHGSQGAPGAQSTPDGAAAAIVAASAQAAPRTADGESPHGPVPAHRDEDAVHRARSGIAQWVANVGHAALHLTPHGIVTALTAAALAPILVPLLIANPASGVVAGALAQLGNVGAEHLARVLQGAVERLRGEAKAAAVSEETLRVVIERTLADGLDGPGAPALGGEMAAILHQVNAIGAAFEAAVFTEAGGLRTHISQAVERLSSESVTQFGVLRGDVRDAVLKIQGDISQVRAIQRDQTEKLDVLLMELAIIHREVSVARPVQQARTAVTAESAAPGESAQAGGATGAEHPRSLEAQEAQSLEAREATREPEPQVRPYPGLAAFGETDAFWFHGRERLTAELVIRLRERLYRPAPLIVLGASGAGKSSVLRAGLIPQLLAGGLAEPGSAHWPRVLMTPGPFPLRSLALRLALLAELPEQSVIDALTSDPSRIALIIRQALLTPRERRERGVVSTSPVLTPRPRTAPTSPDPDTGTARGPVRRLVLVIDQFEELFTLASGDERRQFIDAVCAAAGSANGSGEAAAALVVLGLRGGFVDHCTAHPALGPALRDPLTVGPMDVGELHDAIETPARDAGLDVEPGLAAAMLNDLEAVESPGRGGLTYDPGKLPLLAYALQETWARRSGGRLTVAAYDEAGGIKQALAKKAEEVYARFDPYTARVARRLLEHMVSVREDAEDTRRRMTRGALLDELSTADTEAAATVLDTLEAERLVTADQDVVQIAHEALLRHWPRLAGWLRESRARLPVLHQLTERAREWDRHQRHPDMLLHGAELSLIEKHVNGTDLSSSLGAREAAFVAASKRRRARNQRTRKLFVTALIAALVGVGVFAGIAQRNSTLARHQQAVAQARALAARADGLRATNPQAALLLSLEAYRIDPDEEEAISSLLSAQSGYFTARLTSPSGPANAVAWDPHGVRLAEAGQDGAVTIWDVPDQKPLTELRGHSALYSTAIDPGGRFVAAAGSSGDTLLWDLASGRLIKDFPGDGDAVDTVAFSPDGSLLAAAGDDGAVTLWRTDTLAAAGEIVIGHGSISSVAFSPDGGLLAAACFDESVRLYRLADITATEAADNRRSPNTAAHSPDPVARLGGFSGAVRSVAFSPDSALLAAGGDDGTVRLWAVHTGEPRGVLTGTGGAVRSVAFNPDGTQLASGGEDNAVRLWDVQTRAQLATLDGPANTVAGVAFSPDGHTLAGADYDATIGLWHVAAPPQPGDTTVAGIVDSAHGGGTLATSGTGGRVDVWNSRHPVHQTTALNLAVAQPADGPPIGIALSPDGSTLAAAADNRVEMWNLAPPREVGALESGAPVTAVAYATVSRSAGPSSATCASAAGHGLDAADVVAAASPDYGVYLWDWTDHQAAPTVISKQFGPINAVAISDDGCLLAAASDDGTVMLVRLAVFGGRVTPVYLGQLSGHLGPVTAVAFSPDGRLLASGSNDGTVILWDVSTPAHAEMTATLSAVGGAVTGVAFSGDGRTLASSANDHTIRLWDLGTGSPVTATATLDGPANATGVVFEPGGQTIAAAAADGTALFWTTNPQSLANQICKSRPAAAQQMIAPYLAGATYRPVCP